MERFLWVVCGWKTFPADWNAWLQPDELLNMHYFSILCEYHITWSDCRNSMDILKFFQFPGMYSSILQWNNCPIRFFGRFSSVYQWNIKRNFSLDVYLITLTIHRWDSFASSTWFGFFSSWVLWFGQQFSNFKESYELGVYALPDCLATENTFHRSNRGFLY